MEKGNELPKGWRTVLLKDIAQTIQYGYTESSSKEKNGPKFLRITDIQENKVIWDDVPYCKINDDLKQKYLLKSGDLLFARTGATVGKSFLIEGEIPEAIFASYLIRVRVNLEMNEKYLSYFFYSPKYWKQITEGQVGIGQPNVNGTKLGQLQISIPPLSTQHLIVAKIEELFSEIDKGIEDLKRAQQQLKIYRQSVLKWAFEGKLTNKNVKEGELPKGWEWVKSGDLFDFVTSGSRGWAKYYSSTGAIFIRITNLDFDSLDLNLKESKIQYVNPPLNSEGIRTKVQEGDFLFSITGYLGMFAIAPNLENAYVNQHVSLCRPKDGFNKKFVGYWIVSKSGGHHHLNKNQKGAVKAGLNLDEIKNFPVPLATLIEQQQIVLEIETRLSVADKLEETITQSLQQAEALKQSVLKKAFEGKLLVEKKKEIAKPKNVYFSQVQLLALITKASKQQNIVHGEMTLAKYAYLLDKMYAIPTHYNFKRLHLGPYPIEMKKAINNKEFFSISKNIEVINEEKLFKYNNPYADQIVAAVNDLAFIFSKYEVKERPHKTELLATVCKVVEDIQSMDLSLVRQSMLEWPIELKTSVFKNKAEKFTEEETKKCLAFIVYKGWDKKLIK